MHDVRMSRIVAVTAAVVVAASGGAPAAAGAKNGLKKRCVRDAQQAGLIEPAATREDLNVVVGTGRDDAFPAASLTDGRDLVCGFGGDDRLSNADGPPLALGDVFLGAAGDDTVDLVRAGGFVDGGQGDDRVGRLSASFHEDEPVAGFRGGTGGDVVGFLGGVPGLVTFDGGDGDDRVDHHFGGTFNGGAGNDAVTGDLGGDGEGSPHPHFNGGAGDDHVRYMYFARFDAGDGDDSAGTVTYVGRFLGGGGADHVEQLHGEEDYGQGSFSGGDGPDTVTDMHGGEFLGQDGGDGVQRMYGGTFFGGLGDDYVSEHLGGTFEQ